MKKFVSKFKDIHLLSIYCEMCYEVLWCLSIFIDKLLCITEPPEQGLGSFVVAKVIIILMQQ